MKKLNDFSESHLKYLFDLYTNKLKKAEDVPASFNNPASLYHSVWKDALTLAFVSQALEMDPDRIISNFETAVVAYKKLLKEPRSWFVNPVQTGTAMHLALILGKIDDALEFAAAENFEIKDYQEGSFSADKLVMGYLHVLSLMIRNNPDEAFSTAIMIIVENEDRQEPFIKEYIAYLGIICSICQDLHKERDESFENALREHEHKARNNSLRDDPEALICIKALGLVALSRLYDQTVSIINDYLPLNLIQPTSSLKNPTQ